MHAAVESASNRLLNALRQNNSDSLLALMTDSVVIMPPNEAILKGKPAVKAWYDGLLTQVRTTELTVSDRELLIGGNWATEISGFEWKLAPVGAGAPIVDRGNYVQVWHHEPDGRWLFSRELWNSSIPPAPPAKTP